MGCPGCKVLTGRDIVHPDNACPQAYSFLCRRCHHHGHMTRHCTDEWPQWERPTTLEELIPPDVKLRYGITTQTEICFKQKRGEPGTEREMNNINEIYIPTNYNELTKFAKMNNIDVETVTKYKEENIIAAIKNWGIQHGYRIIEGSSRA